MVIIWIVLSVLFVCGGSAHGYSLQPRTRCAAGGPRVSFTPHPDGRKGHYVAEWCILKQVDGKLWNLKVKYTPWNETLCKYYDDVGYSSSDYETLSYFYQMPIEHTGPYCTYVTCLAIDVDLVATGCFFLMNELTDKNFLKMIAYKATHHYVVSEYPNYSYFKNMSLIVKFFDDRNTVTIIYYFNEYPITTEFMLYAHLIGSQRQEDDDEDLARNCTRGPISVQCELELPYGCYTYSLRWDAPWIRFWPFADREVYHSDHCHNASWPLRVSAPAAAGAGAAQWALHLGLALLAALLAGGALLAAGCHSRRRRRAKHMLGKYWRPVVQAEPGPGGAARAEAGEGGEDSEGEGEEGALVLYQPEPGLAAGEQPGELVRLALQLVAGPAGARAASLYDARSVAAMAAAPAAWLQRRVQRRRARVVALLTPAAATLCSHEPHGRAVPRTPQWGETLLPYALRLVQQDAVLAAAQPARVRDQYRRNYIAVSEGLPEQGGAAVLRDVTPLRRYVLPGAARALLRDVTGTGAGAGAGADQVEPRWSPEVEEQLAPLLARLEDSLRRVRQRAAAHPHYLDPHQLYLE